MRKIVPLQRRHSSPSIPLIETTEPRRLLAVFAVSSPADSGDGTLRAAIESANLTPGLDTISFNIGGGGAQTIAPLTGLPIVTDPIVIDATTQPGFTGTPLITLDGTSVVGSSGMRISAGGSTVRGLRITHFSSNGIALDIADGNMIEGNEITANVADGINVASSNNVIGGTSLAQRNIIAGNGRDGIRISTSGASNQILGNVIGLGTDGLALANSGSGITLLGPGNSVSSGNVISGNLVHGIHINGALASGNTVQGNLIGTDAAGTAAVGNGQVLVSGTAGVRINGAANNTIGGATAAARNIISGNHADGVRVEGAGATGNSILGNFIGTNASGTAAVPNANDGIQVTDAANTIGPNNLVSGNGDDGIELQSSAASGNVIAGNLIGTDVSGTSPLGNGSDAVEIEGAINNTIGGTSAASRNILSGNDSDGVEVIGNFTGPGTGNAITGNLIGVGATGSPLGNGGHGIQIASGGSTTIGGAAPGAANTIANNVRDGVYVATSSGNSIRYNSIFSNGELGIDLDLDGVSPNDPQDLDAGANDVQNFPDIDAAAVTAGGTLVQLSLRSSQDTLFNIDVYASPSADISGYGEGLAHVATTMATTDAGGTVILLVNAGNVAAGQFLTATATDPASNTSEFSLAVAAVVDNTAPSVSSAEFLFDGVSLPSRPHRLTYMFSESVALSLSASDLSLQNLTSGATVPSGAMAVSFEPDSSTAVFTFPGLANNLLPDGRYRATLSASGISDPAGNPMQSDHVFEFFFLTGDANHDARVNLQDFNILAANFGQSNRTFSQGDFNYDGVVNLQDFNLLAARFGAALAGRDHVLLWSQGRSVDDDRRFDDLLA